MVSDRVQFIDVAKAIGLILVIISHSVFPQLMYPFALCFIPIFFVCSGYTQKNKISLRNKFRKLLIPYYIFNTLFIILAVFTHTLSISNIIGVFYGTFSLYPPPMENNLLFLNIGNGPTWFLISLFVSSIWFSLLLRVTKRWLLGLIIIYIMVSYLLKYYIPILLPFQLTTSFYFAILMMSGYLLKKHNLMDNKWLIPFATVIYLLVLWINGDNINLSIARYGKSIILNFIGGLSGSYILLLISKYITKFNIHKILLKINEHGLTLFCIQMPLLLIVKKISYLLFDVDYENILIITAICQTIFTLIVGYYISMALNKLLPSIFK